MEDLQEQSMDKQNRLPIDIQDVKQKLEFCQEKQAQHYNKRPRVMELPPQHVRENVLIHRDDNWEPATVTQARPEPRSHLQKTITGKVFRRNRKHIWQTGMPDKIPEQSIPRKSCIMTHPSQKKRVRWSKRCVYYPRCRDSLPCSRNTVP